MGDMLSQAEINALLSGFDIEMESEDIQLALGNFLTSRLDVEERCYGLFDADVTMLKFFKTKGSEEVLADIVSKNNEQGMGNFKIPNTDIELVNYSVCPTCSTVFTFKDLEQYYSKPTTSPMFKSLREQYRKDTRVHCCNCDTYFLPALIIVDGTPKNEVQFLCRVQTVEAIEVYFSSLGRKVFTRNPDNIVNADTK